MGYLAAISFQMFNFIGVLEIFVTFLIFYVGICQFLLGFAEDIKESFHALEQSSVELRDHPTQITKQSKLYTKISELVTFHGNVIRLSFGHSYLILCLDIFISHTLIISYTFRLCGKSEGQSFCS